MLLLELRDVRVTLGLGLLVDPEGPRDRMWLLPLLRLSEKAKYVWWRACLKFLQKSTCD